MKIKYILIAAASFLTVSCDKDFVEVNTNPYAVTKIDPAILFAGSQRTHLGTWAAEHTIVQHFVNPYNQGATLGFNFNADIEDVNNPKWDQSYTGPIRNMSHALVLLAESPDRGNLKSMIRIWKAHTFMGLVDTYGDIPYSDAGKAIGDLLLFPKYDDDAAIYDDLYNEIKESVAALNPAGDFVPEDLFYGINSKLPTSSAADQVAKWRKLGNSLLLRLGMRYSKLNATKAASIVAEAVAGGVMESNADNAYVKYDGSLFVQDENNNLRNFSYFYYAAEPFVDKLKETNDPRAKFILANFSDPAGVSNQNNPDTVLANQHGAPIGVVSTVLAEAPYRGKRAGGLNYSQINVWTVASPAAPDFFVTYAQTQLLMAEAALRGWIGGDPREYYENGIRANMASYSLYPGTSPITESEIERYLSEPDVEYVEANALELINVQYWIVNIRNGTEAFANFRRSGYPQLAPNTFNNNLNGGFPRRFSYPNHEGSSNSENYRVAAEAIGGDNLLSRVFWDIP